MIKPDEARTLIKIAVAVGAAYFVGVQVGLALRFPPAVTSVVWPPNAILTAALLLTPINRWWVCLAGALPVHFLLQSTVGWPIPLIATFFLTNCSEAFLAAVFIRVFSDEPLRFDTLRRALVLVIGAGIIAPLLSSFADAAVVHHFRGEPYWTVWRTRMFANSLTELAVVPLAVLTVTGFKAAMREVSINRLLEGVLLGSLLIAIGGVAFGSRGIGFELPGLPSTPTVFVLPLFFWAAIRFGPGGLSGALLITALTVSIAAQMGGRAFDTFDDPAQSLIAVQIYLLLMAVPLFAISALLEERRRATRELASRLRFEALLSRLSGSFVRAPSERIVATFDNCLRSTGEFFGIDRVAIMQVLPPGEQLIVFHQWMDAGVPALPRQYSCSMFPWVIGRLLRGEEIVCESIEDLPREACADRAAFKELGLQSATVIPLVASGAVQGVLSLHMVRSLRGWPETTLAQIRIVAEVLANALGRHRMDDALRSSESMKAAILSSLSSLVAVLDKEGVIIDVNERWLETQDREAVPFAAAGIGASYLEVCRRAADRHDRTAAAVLTGVERVLGGRDRSFALEYRMSDGNERWCMTSVVPLQGGNGGAVVSHTDITERKRAELDGQRARHELAHVTRVSTMGELTASLAHQLNQPLAGILSNAQAACRILDTKPADISAVREIVVDIIDDDRRAGAVIQRMRDLMTRGGGDAVVADVNALIRDVTILMTSDTIIRNVALMLDLTPEPPHVRGDRIDLQQVVLNLLMNAMEAVADRPVPERTIVLRSERVDHAVLVSVHDSGPGIRPGLEASIFEPFFTTKATGMGMGLAIARSIVEAHGGRVWAANNPDRGATFYVRLPLVTGAAH